MFKNKKIRNQKYRTKISLILFICLFSISVYTQSIEYSKALNELTTILKAEPKSTSFKKAVWTVEKAYDNNLKLSDFQIGIDLLKDLVKFNLTSKNLKYEGKDRDLIEKYAAIFTAITDTVILKHHNEIFTYLPFRYDFEDFFGEKNWEKMFVTKLLATRKGNCHGIELHAGSSL